MYSYVLQDVRYLHRTLLPNLSYVIIYFFGDASNIPILELSLVRCKALLFLKLP